MSNPDGCVPIGLSKDGPQSLRLDRANRHGLIAGATGTGKTVTLQVLAEGFSRAGVPVFCADVKGDLSGIGIAAAASPALAARAQALNYDLTPQAAPALYWDLLARQGHPVRTTVSELGPLLLSRLLDLSDAQDGVLTIAFKVADDQGLLLLDLDDLQAVLAHVSHTAKQIGAEYGNVSAASVGSIQRKLLSLRQQGAENLFGEPALKLDDLMRTTPDGRGQVSVLAADKLMTTPQLYAVFLLWLISELFETLPEVGDPPKPKLVLFFDEAHLLFNDAPKALLQKVQQVVRLVRSKGVGVYFISQSPADIPDTVLAQLGTRIEHALRAYTPADQAALKAAAASFRPNPKFDTADAIQNLAVGEALVSTLDAAGAPTPVALTRIYPPASRIGPVTPEERAAIMAADPVGSLYDQAVNRESAYERLHDRTAETAADTPSASAPLVPSNASLPPSPTPVGTVPSPWIVQQPGPPSVSRSTSSSGSGLPPAAESRAPAPNRGYQREGLGEALAKSVVRSVGSSVGRALIRGVLGSLSRR